MARRLAVLDDYAEEGWISMDLCAEMLVQHLDMQGKISPTRIHPTFCRRAQRLSTRQGRGPLFNADRLINRFWDYPRRARALRGRFDHFHVCDHSYAQLVHELPAERTGVYCHDLDTFRCLLGPRPEPRPFWFRGLMRRVLDGLRKAGVVFCSTETFRRQIERVGQVDPGRIVLAPLGIAAEFRPEPGPGDASLALPFDSSTPILLNVSSTIPRKRIDVLLEAFARIRSQVPEIRLVQVGGLWTESQERQISRLGIAPAITQLRGLGRNTLAALYRRAALVLMPSESEGFGLPLIEALSCGALVVASELEVFREVGGSSPIYAPVADPEAWAGVAVDLLAGRIEPTGRAERLAWASRYSWAAHAKTIAEAYARLG